MSEQGDGHDNDTDCLVPCVRVGDRFRFTVAAADFIRREPDQSTVVVVCAEIKTEADGTKTLVVHPE